MRNAAASTNTFHDVDRPVAELPTCGTGQLDLPGLAEIRPVGRTGQAVRYRALQPVTGRPVEVLVLDGRPEPRTVQGFVRDGTIGARLSGQSGVVPVFDAGVTPSGLHYLVRPYYARGSLGRHLTDNGPLSWREAVVLVEQIAATTSEIHRWGIVHQGLEPGNIMLTEFLGPMIGAFGSSLPVGADLVVGANPSHLGPYAAPELGRGGAANPTIDVYSLGAVLWALLAGRDPDPATEQPVAAPTPDTPGPLLGLLRRAMSRRVHERPATANAFAADLEQVVRQIETPPRPESRPTPESAHPAPTHPAPAPESRPTPPTTAPVPPITSEMAAVRAAGDRGRTGPTNRPTAAAPTGTDRPRSEGPRAKAPTDAGDRPDLMSKADTRYVLLLVAAIAVVIVWMVIMAMVGVG